MPKTSEMRESKFLKKEDVGRGALGTIADVVQKNVAKEGAEPDLKWCLIFREIDKPLVLNATNIQLCEQVTGSDDTDRWIGHQIVLYTDPNVSYQGKLIGGIRLRAPRQSQPQAIAKPAYVPPPVLPPMVATGPELTDDDIPF